MCVWNTMGIILDNFSELKMLQMNSWMFEAGFQKKGQDQSWELSKYNESTAVGEMAQGTLEGREKPLFFLFLLECLSILKFHLPR